MRKREEYKGYWAGTPSRIRRLTGFCCNERRLMCVLGGLRDRLASLAKRAARRNRIGSGRRWHCHNLRAHTHSKAVCFCRCYRCTTHLRASSIDSSTLAGLGRISGAGCVESRKLELLQTHKRQKLKRFRVEVGAHARAHAQWR